jgi:ATPase subunit of ABC transporter with duplicated ATPase domains
MIEVGMKDIIKSYGADTVLKGVTFDIQTGEKIGLIGSNGCGKTTIFKVIYGIENYEDGFLSKRKDTTIGYLQQVPDMTDEHKTLDVLKKAFSDVFQIQKEMKILEERMNRTSGPKLEKLMKRYGELQESFEHAEGYEIDVKLGKICSGLEISEELQNQNFNTLSGGEKTRVMLGKILLENPDVLLLDEPTNHLDIDSVEWLEEFLKEYEGAALIVSHDRYFLDKVVTKIVELEDGKATKYHGNYSYYVKEKEFRFLAEFENFKNIQKKIKAMKAAAERYRIWGRINTDNNAHMARAKRLEAKIEELQEIRKPKEKRKIGLEFSGSHRSGKDVIYVKNLIKSFEKVNILHDLDFFLNFRERVVILGKNGTGKTTFFRILLGEINPDKGEVKIGSRVNIGYLEQEVVFDNEDLSIVDLFRECFPMTEGEARNKLARFMFYRNDVFKRVKDLSGGEKVRLRLCLLMHQDINFLLLDEPTNHLDIESKEMIEEALMEFDGTILFISHDRYFINKITQRVVELENKKFTDFLGNYNYYREKKTAQGNSTALASKNKEKKKLSSNGKRSVENEIKRYKNRILEIEEEIAWLEREIVMKEEDMKKYPADFTKLNEIYEAKCDLKNRVDKLYEEWGHWDNSDTL